MNSVSRTDSSPRTFYDPSGLLMVERPALVKRLNIAMKRPLTLLSAPSGSGKRTLLREWRAKLPESAIIHTFRGDSAGLRAFLANAPISDEPSTELDYLLIEGVDDFAPNLLKRVIAFANGGTHVIMTAQSPPKLSVGSLVAQGLMTEFQAPELAFTTAEVQALLDARQGQVPSWATERVMEDTWGWPAAVRIVIMHELSWDRVGRMARMLNEFITQEILSKLTDDQLEFLRSLSVVKEITPGLARELSGRQDYIRMLGTIQDEGFPIYWGDQTASIHPLVRQTLLESAEEQDPEGTRALTRKAAEWLLHDRKVLLAAEVTLDARDAATAGRLLRQEFLREFQREPRRLRALVDRAARMDALKPWEAAMMQTMMLCVQQESSSSVATSSVFALLPPDLSLHDRVRLAAFRFFVARQGSYEKADLSNLADIAEDTAEEPGLRLGTEALTDLAWLRMEYGCWLAAQAQFDQANTWLVRGSTSSRLAAMPCCMIQAVSVRAWLTAQQGPAGTTRQLAHEALLEARDHLGDDCTPLTEFAWLALAMLDAENGNAEGCQRHLEQYSKCCEHDRRETRVMARYVHALSHLVVHQCESTVSTVLAVRSMNHYLLPYEDYALSAINSAALFTLGKHAASEAELERMESLWRPGFVPVALAKAHYLVYRGKAAEAFDLLHPLVEERKVHLEKEWLQLLVGYGLASEGSGRPAIAKRAFAEAELLARRLGMDQPNARHNLPLLQDQGRVAFTDAELNVLQQLAPNQTINELAQMLYISPNTVKTHLRRIYQKLGVSSKAEAIERAERMRFIR